MAKREIEWVGGSGQCFWVSLYLALSQKKHRPYSELLLLFPWWVAIGLPQLHNLSLLWPSPIVAKVWGIPNGELCGFVSHTK